MEFGERQLQIGVDESPLIDASSTYQINYCRPIAGGERLGVFFHMTMMGEQRNLRRLAELGQKPECRGTAIVIEMPE